MIRLRPEVAEVIARYGPAYETAYGISALQRRVLEDLTQCRTAALGGHKRQCETCGREQIAYNSCRNRHCPKCQAAARAQWLAAREHDLLDVPYSHVVFTLPAALGPLARRNKRLVYGMLFRAVAETLSTLARDPKLLGAEIGFLAILHTWGQKLEHHPHLHCLVPAGGISPDGERWVPCRPRFFLPVRVLSRFFRRTFLADLRKAFSQGRLAFHGKLEPLASPENWSELLGQLEAREWVVYAGPPFGGPKQVLKYLARYTHRVAISNQRLIALRHGRVTFRWKDYAHGNRHRTLTLDAVEFIRRFLLHSLPSGLQRIRHYGFLANRVRNTRLALCRELLRGAEPAFPVTDDGREPNSSADSTSGVTATHVCPACGKGPMLIIAFIPPTPLLPRPPDTS